MTETAEVDPLETGVIPDERVVRVLKEAWAAVEAAALPSSVQSVAYSRALDLIVEHSNVGASRLHIVHPGSQGRESNGKNQTSEVAVPGDEQSFFSILAEESGISEEKLRRVYYLKDGELRIGLTKVRLGATEAERNRNLALLLAGVRWFAYGQPAVSLREVRDAAGRIPYQVSRNLGKHLDKVPGTVPAGAKLDKTIRVQTGKFDEPYRELIERLTTD